MKRMLLLALLGVTACNDPHAHLSPDFGNAVYTNTDAQVVNPKPTLGLANTNGQRIDSAIRRYQTNTVYPPRPESGTTFGGGGGSTSGGGGTPAGP